MANRGKNPDSWRVGKLEQLFRHTGLFLWSLRGSKSNVIITGYSDHWRGAASKGSQIMTSGSSWQINIDRFDDFEWLRDLRAFGGSQARSRARSLIGNWLKVNGRWNAKSWQPDIMGKRLANLVFCYDWYGSSADETFQQQISNSIGLQARCLAIDWKRLNDHDARVGALRGLIIAEAALGADTSDLDNLMKFLVQLIDGMIHADGGHKSRMPDRHLAIMRDLIEIRSSGIANQIEQLAWLDTTIAKMGAICRMWRHADGQFARFNGAGLSDPEIIEETLARAGQKGKLLQQAPYSGFLRFSSGRSTVIMDVGQPAEHADMVGLGTLGFEFAVGQNLLVVNPGQITGDDNLHRLLSSTKAHSTLTLDGQNSSDFNLGRFAKTSDVEMGPAEGGLLAIASHSGYETSHGVIHHRKLYLSTGGGNLRGADRLEYSGAPGEIARMAVIRFHLHPRVTVAMLRDQRVLIKIRGNRAGWVFRASASVTLDTSLFFDMDGRKNCQQIVINVPLADLRSIGAVDVKWAFQRNEPL
jgi:uncharacterized heparinase superfamily protein